MPRPRVALRAAVAGLIVSALALAGAGVSRGAVWEPVPGTTETGSSIAIPDSSSVVAAVVPYDPATDLNSLYNTTAYTGATAWWNAGYTGAGVDVALIDTGVSRVEGLATPGKIVYGPDLSFESQAPNLTRLDTHTHGTFMAGLIAGHDSALTVPYANAPASAYRGMAPDARIVSVKVGVADGGVDVSQVIAAIDWVVQHRSDNGLNIRVINLSYGTNSTQASVIDPLSYAVEQAWKKGIVVVAAAGNTGFQVGSSAPGLADPAYNPYVIAVGGSDSMGTSSIADDTVGSYSAGAGSCGLTSCRAPDFVAPGSHMQGLRVPGSWVDQNHPEGMIDPRYFRGSGTSQAAAIVSGAVALILQKYPRLTPDQVKAYLAGNTVKLSGAGKGRQGSGEIALTAMLGLSPARSSQSFTNGTGTGTLEGSRGTDHVSDDGVVLTGERDIFGHSFNSAAMAKLEASGSSWSGGVWNGSTWSGSTWSGSTWSGSSWSGNSWSGNSWSGSTWSGNTWSGNTWSGSTWSGNSWSGSTWSGSTWSDAAWLGATWD